MKKIFVIFLIISGTIVLSGCQKISKPDQSSDWKIYTNTIHGYQFQYPGNWRILGEDKEGVFVTIINQDTLKFGNNPQISINYLFDENDRKFFSSEQEKDEYKLQIKNEKKSLVQSLKDSTYPKQSINGLLGYYLGEIDSGGGIGEPEVVLGAYFIREENDIFELRYSVPYPRVIERIGNARALKKESKTNQEMSVYEHEQLFKQITATFKSIR